MCMSARNRLPSLRSSSQFEFTTTDSNQNSIFSSFVFEWFRIELFGKQCANIVSFSIKNRSAFSRTPFVNRLPLPTQLDDVPGRLPLRFRATCTIGIRKKAEFEIGEPHRWIASRSPSPCRQWTPLSLWLHIGLASRFRPNGIQRFAKRGALWMILEATRLMLPVRCYRAATSSQTTVIYSRTAFSSWKFFARFVEWSNRRQVPCKHLKIQSLNVSNWNFFKVSKIWCLNFSFY